MMLTVPRNGNPRHPAGANAELLRILRASHEDGTSPEKRLHAPDAAVLLIALAYESAFVVSFPPHVDRDDLSQELLAHLYASLPRLDPTQPPLAQLRWLRLTLRGAVLDYARRHSNGIRHRPNSAPGPSRRSREVKAASGERFALPADVLALERINARAVLDVIAKAASVHPECRTCQRALQAVNLGVVEEPICRSVRYHPHLVFGLLELSTRLA